jgi:hypothetical protein
LRFAETVLVATFGVETFLAGAVFTVAFLAVAVFVAVVFLAGAVFTVAFLTGAVFDFVAVAFLAVAVFVAVAFLAVAVFVAVAFLAGAVFVFDMFTCFLFIYLLIIQLYAKLKKKFLKINTFYKFYFSVPNLTANITS